MKLTINDAENEDCSGMVMMELSPEMQLRLIGPLGLEIPMMQGTRKRLPDGRTRFEFYVDHNKGLLMKRFVLGLIAIQEQPIIQN